MKKVMLILVLVLVMASIMGCDFEPKEKKINGIVCRMHGYTWTPLANLCINCGKYQLSKYCTACGTKQSLVVGRARCPKCKKLNYVSENYCGDDGNKNVLILIDR